MLQELKDSFNRLVAKREYISQQLDRTRRDLTDKESLYTDHFEAREIVIEVIRLTQQNFKEKVEPLIRLCIRSVFEKPYDFELRFEKKRNQIECYPIVLDGKNELRPKDDLGGSVVDVISLALRTVLWSIEKPRSRNFFILDEPFKNLGRNEELLLAGQILKDISNDLKLQLIIVTHSSEFAEIADTVYEVFNDGVESVVRQIKGGEVRKDKVIKKRKLIVL